MTEREAKSYWHNYRTDKTEYRSVPQTDAEAVEFIPQIPAAQNLYALRRKMGATISEAMIDVLSACIPEQAKTL